MSQLNILIVGASIAGPTAAYWFAKAGAKVTVIERFPQLRTNGQNIDIRTVGVTVMRKMPGMEGAVRAKVAPVEGISFVREDGRPYGVLRPTGNPDQQSLISEYEIFRGDLAKILVDMTEENENVKYVFNEQVVSIQQQLGKDGNDGPVTVEFANGYPTSQFDLVIACDGATSRTRAIGLDCGVRDYVHSTNSWVAYCSLTKDIIEGQQNIGMGYSSVGGRFMAIGADQVGRNRVVFMAMQPRSGKDAVQPFREALKQGDDAVKQFLAKHYAGAGWKTDEALKGMIESEDLYASEIVQVKPPHLYKGRFVMVGDAGYAPGPTGAGTSLALAGAYLLAGEISKHKGDLTAGLKGYEEQMQPLLAELQKIPPFVHTIMAPQTAWGIWLRNMIFSFICWSGIVEFIQKYLGSAFASSDKFKLPEYEWMI